MTRCRHNPLALAGQVRGDYRCPTCGCPVTAGFEHAPCEERCPYRDRTDAAVERKAMQHMAAYGEDIG